MSLVWQCSSSEGRSWQKSIEVEVERVAYKTWIEIVHVTALVVLVLRNHNKTITIGLTAIMSEEFSDDDETAQ